MCIYHVYIIIEGKMFAFELYYALICFSDDFELTPIMKSKNCHMTTDLDKSRLHDHAEDNKGNDLLMKKLHDLEGDKGQGEGQCHGGEQLLIYRKLNI